LLRTPRHFDISAPCHILEYEATVFDSTSSKIKIVARKLFIRVQRHRLKKIYTVLDGNVDFIYSFMSVYYQSVNAFHYLVSIGAWISMSLLRMRANAGFGGVVNYVTVLRG